MPPAYGEVAQGSAVPATVKIACALTWGFSGLVALLYLGMLLALVFAQDRMVDFVLDSPEWQRSKLDGDVLLPVLWVGCLMFLGWSLGAAPARVVLLAPAQLGPVAARCERGGDPVGRVPRVPLRRTAPGGGRV